MGITGVVLCCVQVIADLDEQLRDVMFSLEAQHKLAEATGLDASTYVRPFCAKTTLKLAMWGETYVLQTLDFVCDGSTIANCVR